MLIDVASEGAKKISIPETPSEMNSDVIQVDFKIVEKEFVNAANNWLAFCGVEIQEKDESNN